MKTVDEIMQEELCQDIFDKLDKIEIQYVKDAIDSYATQQAIEFAKWLNKEGWEEYDESDRWICPSNNRSVYLTSKLYNLFKKANP